MAIGGAGEVIVWDLRTGQQRTTLTGHTQPVHAVACTRLEDGTPIAITGGGDLATAREVIVWDLRTGQQRTTLTGHTRPVHAVACTRLEDGTPIAITGAGGGAYRDAGEVIVWDLRTGQQRTTLTGHTRPVHAVACTRLEDGTPIAITGAGDDYFGDAGEVIVWDLRTGQQRTTLTGHTRPVHGDRLHPLDDGTPIAVTGGGGLGFGGARGDRLGPAHRPAAHHPGRPHPAGERGRLHPPRGRHPHRRHRRRRPPRRRRGDRLGSAHRPAAHHPDRPHPAGARRRLHPSRGRHPHRRHRRRHFGAGAEVIVWDLRTGQQRTTLTGHTQPVHAVACTHLEDGTPIAITGAGDDYSGAGEVIVWDLRTGQQRTTLTGHTQPVHAVACTHLEDGTPIAITGGGDYGGAR